MREKHIIEKLKQSRLTPLELYGLYLALLQIRFVAMAYDIEGNIESELESILMKQVFYRHFEENTGKILDKIYDTLITLFTENPELKKHENRNIFIEKFEQEFLETIRDVGISCVRPWLIPDPWKDIIVKVIEKTGRREYVISDQTLSGSVSLWEGELLNDVQSIQNLTLLEKYMLISNICTFGYNVYLVLPFYIQDRKMLNIITISKEVPVTEPINRREILSKIEKIIQRIEPSAITEAEENLLRVRVRDSSRNISITIINIEDTKDIEKVLKRYQRDIIIAFYSNIKDIEKIVGLVDNIFTIEITEQNARTGLLRALDLISRIVR